MVERILVTGSSGLLGSKIVALAETRYETTPTHHEQPFFTNSVRLDITNEEEVRQTIKKFRPDVVFHTAAETNVDKCEINKSLAWEVNVEGTRNLVDICGETDARLVYVSTDYVFDGLRGFYAEDDEPAPVNYYGTTKLRGEEAARELGENCVIVRTSVLYGWHPWKQNFVTWVMNSLRQKQRISVVDDHYNSPTYADSLAHGLLNLCQKRVSGVFHMAGRRRSSRYDFALTIAREFDLDPSLIIPTKMENLKIWIANRPQDSSLRVDKAQEMLGLKFLDIEEGLRMMKEVGR